MRPEKKKRKIGNLLCLTAYDVIRHLQALITDRTKRNPTHLNVECWMLKHIVWLGSLGHSRFTIEIWNHASASNYHDIRNILLMINVIKFFKGDILLSSSSAVFLPLFDQNRTQKYHTNEICFVYHLKCGQYSVHTNGEKNTKKKKTKTSNLVFKSKNRYKCVSIRVLLRVCVCVTSEFVWKSRR